MKMNVYQEISQIIKDADGILIGGSNGLSIAEGYNIFADDAWFQENMGDFREKYGLRCVLHGFSVPMKVEEKWAFVSRLVKAKAMQDEPSEIMKNIYALVKDKEYFVVTSNAEDHFVPAGFEADRVFEMERWSVLRTMSEIGVPVVFPSKTPERISTRSPSLRAVV